MSIFLSMGPCKLCQHCYHVRPLRKSAETAVHVQRVLYLPLKEEKMKYFGKGNNTRNNVVQGRKASSLHRQGTQLP